MVGELGVLAVGLPGDVDERVFVEVLVREERFDEISGPFAGGGYVGVVPIVNEIWGDERPLREFLLLQLLFEPMSDTISPHCQDVRRGEAELHGKILDLCQTVHILGNGIETDEKVVLALIMTRFEAKSFEARIGQSFVVVSPADTLVFQEINDGRHIFVDQDKAVTIEPKRVAAPWSNVVRLARSPNAVVVGQ